MTNNGAINAEAWKAAWAKLADAGKLPARVDRRDGTVRQGGMNPAFIRTPK